MVRLQESGSASSTLSRCSSGSCTEPPVESCTTQVGGLPQRHDGVAQPRRVERRTMLPVADVDVDHRRSGLLARLCRLDQLLQRRRQLRTVLLGGLRPGGGHGHQQRARIHSHALETSGARTAHESGGAAAAAASARTSGCRNASRPRRHCPARRRVPVGSTSTPLVTVPCRHGRRADCSPMQSLWEETADAKRAWRTRRAVEDRRHRHRLCRSASGADVGSRWPPVVGVDIRENLVERSTTERFWLTSRS